MTAVLSAGTRSKKAWFWRIDTGHRRHVFGLSL